MIEKQFIAALDPVLDAVVAIEKRLDAISLTPGPQGEPGRDGADADESKIAEVIKVDPAFLDRVKGERGEKGDQGEPGRDADPLEVGKAIVGEVAEKLKTNLEETVWAPGIYREGKCVSHFTGRSYQAIADTADEPGDSPHWKRLGTHGLRDTGGFDPERAYEPGDFYHKDGATFFFDGVSHRLFQAKGVTPKDLDKAIKSARIAQDQAIASVIDRQKAIEARLDAIVDALATYKTVLERLDADLDGVIRGA